MLSRSRQKLLAGVVNGEALWLFTLSLGPPSVSQSRPSVVGPAGRRHAKARHMFSSPGCPFRVRELLLTLLGLASLPLNARSQR